MVADETARATIPAAWFMGMSGINRKAAWPRFRIARPADRSLSYFRLLNHISLPALTQSFMIKNAGGRPGSRAMRPQAQHCHQHSTATSTALLRRLIEQRPSGRAPGTGRQTCGRTHLRLDMAIATFCLKCRKLDIKWRKTLFTRDHQRYTNGNMATAAPG